MSKLSYIEICRSLFNLSNTIIKSVDSNFSSWSKWKYRIYFETLDLLTMLYSQKLRVGLKEMQVTMQFRCVQEYEGDFQSWLPLSEIPNMIKYNINDVDSTEELLYRCQKDIDLRLAIEDEYGVKVLNKDGVNIGMKIITQKYLEKTGQTWNQIKDLRSPCDMIELNKIILPFIEFKTPVLQELLKELKTLTVSPGRKGLERTFVIGGVKHLFSVGGLHSENKPSSFQSTDTQVIVDQDVTSLYPSMIIEHGFYPPHLGKEFLEVYGQIKKERVEAKRNGNKIKDATLKLALNGLSGNLQNEHNFCYSPETVLKIRINGQLFLLMLIERLISVGAQIIQSNTDGVFYIIDRNKLKDVDRVCKEWEDITKLGLEADYFEAMYQFAINDYLAIKEGYSKTKNPKLIKKKGLFIDEVHLGKGMQAMIIPEAINKCLADGIPVEETIRECKNINKFITYQKVSKDYSVEYGGKIIQRINRYYISTDGPWLYKCKIDSNGRRYNYIKLLTDSGVTIMNTINKSDELPSNINYSFYIAAAQKIVCMFKHKQLKLF